MFWASLLRARDVLLLGQALAVSLEQAGWSVLAIELRSKGSGKKELPVPVWFFPLWERIIGCFLCTQLAVHCRCCKQYFFAPNLL